MLAVDPTTTLTGIIIHRTVDRIIVVDIAVEKSDVGVSWISELLDLAIEVNLGTHGR